MKLLEGLTLEPTDDVTFSLPGAILMGVYKTIIVMNMHHTLLAGLVSKCCNIWMFECPHNGCLMHLHTCNDNCN